MQATVAGGAVASSATDAGVCGFLCVYELLNSSLQTFFSCCYLVAISFLIVAHPLELFVVARYRIFS